MECKLPPPAPLGDAFEEKEPVLSGPKRQHFLPRFYLESFSQNGLVVVYDRDVDEVRIQQPVNTAVIGHFYTLRDEEGRKRFELEQVLSDYEAKAKPAIDKLAARESLDADERADLAIFVALGAMRTPDVIESVERFNSGMAQSDALTVKTNHQWAVGRAIEMALEIAPILAGRNWVVVHRDSDKRSFITTDAPVLLTTVAPRRNNFWGIGFGNTDALVFFPLTQACMLAMFGNAGELRHVSADSERMRQLNRTMAAKCQRFLVGRNEKLVRSLAKAACLCKTTWRPKMQPM